jgi:DNA-binding CsgD family transcriptional regulator
MTRPLAGVPLGRDAELALLEAFIHDALPGSAVELMGGPGIGKTTLWEHAVTSARELGLRVLVARSSSAEAQPAFAALVDLFDEVLPGELDGLAPPQQRALAVALRREEPDGSPVDRHAIALGCLNALRALGGPTPVLIALDDVQWLDAPSAAVLEFVEQRIGETPVMLLLTRREGESSALEPALRRAGMVSVQVGPLTIGATRQLLFERLGLTVSRGVMRRIAEVTLGNPLFAIELGRAIRQRKTEQTSDEIPVPASVQEVLGVRVAALTGEVRLCLAVLALSADVRVAQLTAVVGSEGLDEAADAGIVLIDGDRVRAAHPLLAATAQTALPRGDLRRLHLALAAVVADEGQRALHLALAADGFDEELAETVAEAAVNASARGARAQAVSLSEHALRLTPPRAASRSERVLELAAGLETAGELARMTELLEREVGSLPQGMPRARAWLMLSEGSGPRNLEDLERYRARALAEAGPDPGMNALVLAKQASNTAASRVTGIAQAERWALEAMASARDAGPVEMRLALYALSWARAMGGRPIADLCAAFRSASDAPTYVAASPERVDAQRLVWRGEIQAARSALTALLALADEQGERESYALMRLHACELSLREGDWARATGLLDEWAESADRKMMFRPKYERCRALLAAGLGEGEEAQRWATDALDRAEASGSAWDGLEASRALGSAQLLEREPAAAVLTLRGAWEHTVREGVEEPGVFPLIADLVEGLIETGELDQARTAVDRVARLSRAQSHPWGLATSLRCTALIDLAAGEREQLAAQDLDRAVQLYEEMELRFDAARTLLCLGRSQRRLRKWGEARRNLGRAAAILDELGSGGWSQQASEELERVAARRPSSAGELTPSEGRTAELAARGLSNKEIARELVVTVHTVEVHLSRAYAKLGIRSRSQLAARLSERDSAKD